MIFYMIRLNSYQGKLVFKVLRTGSEVIKLYSCSTKLSMKFILLINVKMLTIIMSMVTDMFL